MSRIYMAIAGVCLLAGSALANDAVVRSHNLEVKERLAHLERIDVTAEKAPSAEAEELDETLLAILDEADAAEQ